VRSSIPDSCLHEARLFHNRQQFSIIPHQISKAFLLIFLRPFLHIKAV
jgi:hypothetical protein